MKKTNLFFLLSLFVSVIAFSSCDDKDDKDDKDETPYVGSYTISNATLRSPVDIPYVIGDEANVLTVPAGSDFTKLIKGSLLGVIEDCSEDASLIDLNEDYSMSLTCSTTDWSLKAGIWEEKEEGTVIVMTFNGNAIPSSPDGFVLKITNVDLKDGVMSSTTDAIPFPKEVGSLIIAGAIDMGFLPKDAVLDPSAPPFFSFIFDMKMLKQ